MSSDVGLITLVCTEVIPQSANVLTFNLKAVIDGTFPHFNPGQFLTLTLDIDGESVRRCYTLSSCPKGQGLQDEISITVKIKDGGKASNWLHKNLLPGVEINALPPAGRFLISDHAPEKYAFFAGGVGITPVLSMARWLAQAGEQLDIVFVQCSSNASDLLFVEELKGYAKLPGFRLHLQPSRDPDWQGPTGRLNVEQLSELVPDLAQRKLMCCGPDGFMSHVESIAHALGVPPGRYHQESFEVDVHGFGNVEEAAKDETYTLLIESTNELVPCRGDQSILDAAREAGVYIPYSCEAGICGSCKVRVSDGSVSGQHDGGIEDHESDEGWTLACCYRPITNLKLEL